MIKLKNGFTLMELMVSVGVLGILIVSATALFFSSIRGGGKVEVTTTVKQNGQVALNTIEQKMRNAKSVVSCVSTPSTSINLVDQNDQTMDFECVDVGQDTGSITIDGSSVTSDAVALMECEFSCTQSSGGLSGPLVKVNFSLSQAGSAAVHQVAEVDFSTSVYVRSIE